MRETGAAWTFDHHIRSSHRRRRNDLVLGNLRILLPAIGRGLQLRALEVPHHLPVFLHYSRHVRMPSPAPMENTTNMISGSVFASCPTRQDGS